MDHGADNTLLGKTQKINAISESAILWSAHIYLAIELRFAN